ncbi:hypothetical protein K505DRAFT_242405 [Melanomma pulvis-pyrius CBS 109.77]|uniref:Uncharacterized protein n=1 Tax=Melanomma pulvis-pyrius CBS 109.77 TaxID=1314802 RepID=A0A6A6XDF5_9PLEO|nr:hypothetical protein K505DRAFT_242405 [Melanomma pulvis-pyrius CBS 109.77]
MVIRSPRFVPIVTVIYAIVLSTIVVSAVISSRRISPPKGDSTKDLAIGDSSASQDLYGIGVRIGFYLQAAAGSINAFRPLRLPAGGTPIIFSSAVFVAILASWNKLAVDQKISPAETIVIFNILGSNVTAIVTSIFQNEIRGDAIDLFLFNFMFLWQLAVMLWFWTIEQYRLPCLNTNGYTWLIVRVKIDGWYRKFMIVNSVLGTFMFCCFSLNLNGLQTWNNDEYDRLKCILRVASIVSWVLLPIFVATAELTIVQNRLKGHGDISTPGQLIPLVAGVTSLVDAFSYLCRPQKRGDTKRNFVL